MPQIKLSKAAINNLEAPAEFDVSYQDKRYPGLSLIVQSSGHKSWAVRYRHQRRLRKFTIGPWPAFDVPTAWGSAAAAIRAVAQGRDPLAEKQEAQRRELVDVYGQLARQYAWDHCRPVNRSWRETARLLGLRLNTVDPNPRTAEAGLLAVSGDLAERWAIRPVASITKREIVEALDWAAKDAQDGRKGGRVARNRRLRALQTFFGWCMQRDIIGASPCAGLKTTKEDSRDRVLSDEELRWLWRAAMRLEHPSGPWVRMLILLGQRRDETADMRMSEIKGSVWTIPKDRVKNGIEHEVPLTQALVKSIAAKAHKSGLVFTTTGDTPISGYSKIKIAIDDLMFEEARKDGFKGNALEPWAFHDLRRTCASGMAAQGVDPHIIEAVLNHKSGSIKGVAAVYNRHKYLKEKGEALKRWADHIAVLVK